MGFPLERVRADTPGVEGVVHLNNAGSALPTRQTVDTVVEHLHLEQRLGGYEAQAVVADRVEGIYASVARLLGAEVEQVALTDSATRSWDTAVHGYPFQRGDRVLVSRAEYASNAIALLQLRKRFALELVLIEDDEHGQVSLAALERELAVGAAMVSLVHVPTSGGLVNPAREVGELCRAYDTFLILDACQSLGQLPLDVTALGCDVLSATGRKYLRAPRGTGVLYLSDRALERLTPPFLDLHSATWLDDETYVVRDGARAFETWERSIANVLGLGAAADYAHALGEPAWARIQQLGRRLRDQLATVPGVTVHDRGQVLGGIVTFSVAGTEPLEVQSSLRAASIHVSVSSAASARLDLGHRGLEDVLRASVHYYNTDNELDALVDALPGVREAPR